MLEAINSEGHIKMPVTFYHTYWDFQIQSNSKHLYSRTVFQTWMPHSVIWEMKAKKKC